VSESAPGVSCEWRRSTGARKGKKRGRARASWAAGNCSRRAERAAGERPAKEGETRGSEATGERARGAHEEWRSVASRGTGRVFFFLRRAGEKRAAVKRREREKVFWGFGRKLDSVSQRDEESWIHCFGRKRS